MADTETPGTTTSPGASADPTPFMLSTGPFGIGRIVSTAQTNFSASDLVSAFGKHDVEVELQTLTVFATKVEALLAAMEGSAAAPYKLQEQKLEGKHFASAHFAEATALTDAYGKVHTQLVKLHKDFVAQIEAMKSAVSRTASSYSSNEENTTAAQDAVAKNTGVATSATTQDQSVPKPSKTDI